MISSPITIKGSRDGLRLQIDETAAWPDVLSALQEQLTRGSSFFQGARVILDVGERSLEASDLSALMAMMEQFGLTPELLHARDRASRNAARTVGLAARAGVRSSVEGVSDSETGAVFVVRTLRSGQLVRHPGHVTVVGDVNPGAEIIAGGNVLVWGRLRGMVHAGALGDRQALCGALELRPTQLRIADLFATTPQGEPSRRPEVARVEDGQIVVNGWDGYRR